MKKWCLSNFYLKIIIRLLVFLYLVCLFGPYLMNHSSQLQHCFLIACITWYLNDDSPLHIYILLICLFNKFAVFMWIMVRTVRKNEGKIGKKRGLWRKSGKVMENQGIFLWSAKSFTFLTKSGNFLNFQNFWNLVVAWNFNVCTWILILY